jgi:hypothetical protein
MDGADKSCGEFFFYAHFVMEFFQEDNPTSLLEILRSAHAVAHAALMMTEKGKGCLSR